MDAREKYFWGLVGAMCLGLLLLSLLHVSQGDLSARQNEQRRKLGAVYMTLNNPFYEVVDEEIRTVVENHGDVLISRDPALSVERQREEIRELIAEGVEVIFINPVDWKRIEPALEEAYAAHVPVIAIDTSVQDEKYVACTVMSDNYMAGVQCASHLLATSSGGQIALLKHSQAHSSVDRIQGFKDTLAGHPEFQIVDEEECLGQLELAMPAMERILTAHPEVSIVMALNDPAAMGAMAALQNAGRLDTVKVYGVDGVPETKEMIRQGHMTATAGQSPRQIGKRAAEQAYRLLAGEETERVIQLKTQLLTRRVLLDGDKEGWN
ncbi:ribose transport system substrate-binding protein [Selenomonas sp. GACV-9]|uniref:sugar ABC transporter substrate-binding protein n=1 Tax=Selenomonas sp. GACV-9 TaxID=3158782 RepID=UPI0008F1750B|nr:ribose transport system substrate-binding protein [Selenomonas ruminantium]